MELEKVEDKGLEQLEKQYSHIDWKSGEIFNDGEHCVFFIYKKGKALSLRYSQVDDCIYEIEEAEELLGTI